MIYRVVFRQLNTEEETVTHDLACCSQLVRNFIINNDISADDWLAGEVYAGDELISRIAFNGAEMP